jgi:hypothetical protein
VHAQQFAPGDRDHRGLRDFACVHVFTLLLSVRFWKELLESIA